MIRPEPPCPDNSGTPPPIPQPVVTKKTPPPQWLHSIPPPSPELIRSVLPVTFSRTAEVPAPVSSNSAQDALKATSAKGPSRKPRGHPAEGAPYPRTYTYEVKFHTCPFCGPKFPHWITALHSECTPRHPCCQRPVTPSRPVTPRAPPPPSISVPVTQFKPHYHPKKQVHMVQVPIRRPTNDRDLPKILPETRLSYTMGRWTSFGSKHTIVQNRASSPANKLGSDSNFLSARSSDQGKVMRLYPSGERMRARSPVKNSNKGISCGLDVTDVCDILVRRNTSDLKQIINEELAKDSELVRGKKQFEEAERIEDSSFLVREPQVYRRAVHSSRSTHCCKRIAGPCICSWHHPTIHFHTCTPSRSCHWCCHYRSPFHGRDAVITATHRHAI